VRRSLRALYTQEFRHYGAGDFRADLLAGLTVAAVALPLALAFGVASGATASAGLVTAIAAGLVIGALSGAPYQISGPTGAMSAVLIVLAQRHGLPGVWVAGGLAGVLLLAIGFARVGRFIGFIPAPVVSGFTSGIACIIVIGQIDPLLGVKTARAATAAAQLSEYLRTPVAPHWPSAVLGAVTIAWLLGIRTDCIGAIPRTIVLAERLHWSAIPWADFREFLAPAASIAALGAVESLLCGAVGSNMTGVRLAANQELLAQGAGNVLLPFIGGVPATAAIARTSVGIRSGGRTRMVSIVHALTLLLSMFVLAPVMSRIPLAALAGVLMVTAWRMNEWESIRFVFGRRFKTAIATFLVTMVATVVLDLTHAILVGAAVSALVFLNQIAGIRITVEPVDPQRLRERGIAVRGDCADVHVAYVSGPLFFAAVGTFNETFANLSGVRVLVLSMRGVPLVDTTGLQALQRLQERLAARGCRLYLAALQPPVHRMLARSGAFEGHAETAVFASADQAIVAADAATGAALRGPVP